MEKCSVGTAAGYWQRLPISKNYTPKSGNCSIYLVAIANTVNESRILTNIFILELPYSHISTFSSLHCNFQIIRYFCEKSNYLWLQTKSLNY